MLGTVIGDIYGSCYEKSRTLTRALPALTSANHFTDDTVITMAVVEHMLEGVHLQSAFKSWVAMYPKVGYGKRFEAWAEGRTFSEPASFGNGALMRIGPVAALEAPQAAAKQLARDITMTTHGDPIALRAVDQYVELHWAALQGSSKTGLLQLWATFGGRLHSVEEMHRSGSPMRLRADDTLEDVMSCLAESDDFETLIATCLYHGGDSDTIAAVAGVLGEALWGIPPDLEAAIRPLLDDQILEVLAKLYSQPQMQARAGARIS